ncbi:MAG: hypothetical protein F6K28_23885 [Microcoleus sp. SIO2G3]|nr:hypothetical protein [Microcoleus sp. SIO2G3]
MKSINNILDSLENQPPWQGLKQFQDISILAGNAVSGATEAIALAL